MLPEPHGGRLVRRLKDDAERLRREGERDDLLSFVPFIDIQYDAEKIGIGAYSPLQGFMGSEEVDTVLEHNHLPNGLPWSMPILCAPAGTEAEGVVAQIRPGDEIGLRASDGDLLALLHVEEKFPVDRPRIAEKVYGTTDRAHPNVADLNLAGSTAVAGPVDLLRRLPVASPEFELTPAETRARFDSLGWTRVAGYQCRNPPHTAHEYIQRATLEREDVDGLFIQPILGRLKKGDYRPEVILRAYQALVAHYYPANRVLLASLSITMRYGGPQAALFYAIVRKNYGCSHYIVGRDQAGVGTYYDPYACHRVFDRYDVGVVPLRYLESFFCRVCGGMASEKTCAHGPEARISTSQTRLRRALEQREPLPTEVIRPEVAAILQGTENVLID